MGGATNCPETPRQKMIGMMYIVLTAMLALNVAADILNGFTMVETSLKVNTESNEKRNLNLYAKFQDSYSQNPTKVKEWLDKANDVKRQSDDLYNKLQDLKVLIVKTADGPEGDVDHISARDNLDASGRVGLDDGMGEGRKIRAEIEKYRENMKAYVKADESKVSLLDKTFSTDKVVGHDGTPQEWQVATFEMMPVAATITILSKIQADVRATEGEVVTYLKNMVDADDYRVNKIEAKVIPDSKYVMRGGRYHAEIVLVASDSTQRPEVYIGGNPSTGTGGTLVKDGIYDAVASATGDRKYAGYIRLSSPTGVKVYPFESDYNVGEPTAIISADQMNVFYAGIDNPVSISVPGVPASSINATMTGGSLRRTSSGWVVRPNKPGTPCEFSITVKMDGKMQNMGKKSFRVKQLPPPIAYIPFRDEQGNPQKHKTGKIRKATLLAVTELRAELDDADIEAHYDILGFEMNIQGSMGAIIETSPNKNFTERQMSQIKGMARGSKFFLSNIKAKGPDGVVRALPPMEVVLN